MPPPRVLFLVHGMGEANDEWAQGIGEDLRGYAAAYGLEEAWSAVELVPVLYNRIFADELERLKASTERLGELAESGLGTGAAQRFLEWVKAIPSPQKDFFWRSAMDVMMYRYHADVRSEVQATVLNRFQETLGRVWGDRDQADQKPNVHVLAHSLGTAVTHDCLGILGTSSDFGSGFYRAESVGQLFEAIYMVANVSRVVQHDQWDDGCLDVYRSVVHPIADRAGLPSYCERYWDFNHRYDPIPQIHAFDPGAEWTDCGSYVRVGGIEHYVDPNTHDLANYLRHPRVHIPILNTLLTDWADGGSPIPDDVAMAAITEFDREFAFPPGIPETIASVAEGAINVAKAILDRTGSPEPALALVALLTAYFSLFPPGSGGES